jgi:hypothetical protein
MLRLSTTGIEEQEMWISNLLSILQELLKWASNHYLAFWCLHLQILSPKLEKRLEVAHPIDCKIVIY